MEINGGKIITNETNENAMGGSEIIATALANRLDPELLQHFQIVNSRVRELDPTKIRVFVAHDLPGDPESEFLKNGGYDVFHKLVFVSHWQMQAYINYYNIPWSRCIVMQNAIDPIEQHVKPIDTIKLAYWSTPHRGLNILVPVFEKLVDEYDNIELDVFSSFKLYGWEKRDEQYQTLFDQCRTHPKITYHGTVDNQTIRQSLTTTHILAYPSIWQETSCLVLMEAMSAGLVCVHPNYGALAETAANFTTMYQWNEDINAHAGIFYAALKGTIDSINAPFVQNRLEVQKSYANVFYNWQLRAIEWDAMLKSLLHLPRELPKPKFVYDVG